MVRRYGLAGCRLAAFAIASALMLAGASGAVVVADPGAESAARTDGNHRADDGNHRADSGSVGSETGDPSASTTRGSGGNGKGRGGRPGDDQTSSGGRQPRSGQSGGRKPAGAESGAGTRPGDARPPTRLPAPPPEDPAPPPTDLPPVDKGVPVEAEVRDAATAAVPGEAGRVSTGSVISVPASPLASPPNGLGPSVVSRGIASPPAPEAARVSTGSVISVPASPLASPPNGLGPSVVSRGIASPPAPEAARVSTGSVISVPASPLASPPNGLGPSVVSRGIASPPAPEAARRRSWAVGRIAVRVREHPRPHGCRPGQSSRCPRPRWLRRRTASGRRSYRGDSESTGTRGRTGVDRVSHLGARVPAGFAAERPRAVGRIAGDSESTGTRGRTGVDRVSHLGARVPAGFAAERPRAVGRIARDSESTRVIAAVGPWTGATNTRAIGA